MTISKLVDQIQDITDPLYGIAPRSARRIESLTSQIRDLLIIHGDPSSPEPEGKIDAVVNGSTVKCSMCPCIFFLPGPLPRTYICEECKKVMDSGGK